MRILVDTSAYSAFFRGHQEIVRELGCGDELVLTPTVLALRNAALLAERPADGG